MIFLKDEHQGYQLQLKNPPLAKALQADNTFPVKQVAISKKKKNSRYQDTVMIDTIHDGHIIPTEFSNGMLPQEVSESYFAERDWGSDLIAQRLAKKLKLKNYLQVSVARTLLDYGRLPGSTPEYANHMSRLSINKPFSDHLSNDSKRELLEVVYDKISTEMEKHILQSQSPRKIKISIHTYDKKNDSGTTRQPASILYRPLSYQERATSPFGVFDPLFPQDMYEATADELLINAIQRELILGDIHTSTNAPYCLPEGSVEVRVQVWYFFKHLKDLFQQAYPEKDDSLPKNEHYRLVWDMLTNTNSRHTKSIMLSDYLHKFAFAPNDIVIGGAFFDKAYKTVGKMLQEAEPAYHEIQTFFQHNKAEILGGYSFRGGERINSLAIEVRKDWAWNYQTQEPKEENIESITTAIKNSLDNYLSDVSDH